MKPLMYWLLPYASICAGAEQATSNGNDQRRQVQAHEAADALAAAVRVDLGRGAPGTQLRCDQIGQTLVRSICYHI